MVAGRPQKVDPGALYAFAHQFYWDFRRIAEGGTRYRFDHEKFANLEKEIGNVELLIAETAEQVRIICADAFTKAERKFEPGIVREVSIPNWPISVGSVLPIY